MDWICNTGNEYIRVPHSVSTYDELILDAGGWIYRNSAIMGSRDADNTNSLTVTFWELFRAKINRVVYNGVRTISDRGLLCVGYSSTSGMSYCGVYENGVWHKEDRPLQFYSAENPYTNLYAFESNGVISISDTIFKTYSFKIINGLTGDVFFNLRPCLYEGEYGLWDTISNKFYGNVSGVGAFTGGND